MANNCLIRFVSFYHKLVLKRVRFSNYIFKRTLISKFNAIKNYPGLKVCAVNSAVSNRGVEYVLILQWDAYLSKFAQLDDLQKANFLRQLEEDLGIRRGVFTKASIQKILVGGYKTEYLCINVWL